jgi:hypothetical protein
MPNAEGARIGRRVEGGGAADRAGHGLQRGLQLRHQRFGSRGRLQRIAVPDEEFVTEEGPQPGQGGGGRGLRQEQRLSGAGHAALPHQRGEDRQQVQIKLAQARIPGTQRHARSRSLPPERANRGSRAA